MSMTSASTMAKTGRSMKKRAIAGVWGLFTTPAAAGAAASGRALTTVPGRAFCTPSTTTVSPARRPSVISHWSPTRSPVFTGRCSTLPPSPTTETKDLPSNSVTAFCGTTMAFSATS